MANKNGKYIQFRWNISAYHPESLQSGFSERELRQEYSRLRDVAQKRLKRLGASEFRDTAAYGYNEDRFIPTRDVSGIDELSHLLSDVAKFLTASTSTVTGQKEYRRKSVESLHEGGLKSINESNFKQMTDVLQWASAFREYDPSALVRMMNEAVEKGIDLDEVLYNLKDMYDIWTETGSLDAYINGGWDE